MIKEQCPKTLQDAVKYILSRMTAKEKDMIKNSAKKDLIGSELNERRYNNIYDNRRKIKYLRGDALNVLIGKIAKLFIEKEKELLEGKFDSSLIDYIDAKDVLDKIKKHDQEKVYRSRQVLEIEAAGFEMLPGILGSFLNALSKPESDKSKKILALIPRQYLNKRTELFNRDYEKQEYNKGVVLFDTDYENILTIVQYVASMTDNFAVDTYRLLKGISLPSY